MARRYLARLTRRDDDRSDAPEDPSLRPLFLVAQRLIHVLETGTEEQELEECVPAYVRCAVEQGISRARIRDVLEHLVREHAPPDGPAAPGSHRRARHRQVNARLLEAVLRFAA
jgi:hypothetical protein